MITTRRMPDKTIHIFLTGTNGSGKDTVAKLLVDNHGFEPYNVRALIEDEMERRNCATRDRMTMRRVMNELREAHGNDFAVRMLLERAIEAGKPGAISSVRAPAEALFVTQQDAALVAVDAPLEERFRRALARNSSTDRNLTLDQFREEEEIESRSTDPGEQNIAFCMKLAEYTIWNDGSLEQLGRKIAALMRKIRGE